MIYCQVVVTMFWTHNGNVSINSHNLDTLLKPVQIRDMKIRHAQIRPRIVHEPELVHEFRA